MNPLAVNGQARIQSFGLGQLTERTARKVCGLQQKDIFDMSKNIDCAAKHLSSQVKRYNGDLDKAASSYNAGHFTQHNKKYVRLVRANLARNFCKIP